MINFVSKHDCFRVIRKNTPKWKIFFIKFFVIAKSLCLFTAPRESIIWIYSCALHHWNANITQIQLYFVSKYHHYPLFHYSDTYRISRSLRLTAWWSCLQNQGIIIIGHWAYSYYMMWSFSGDMLLICGVCWRMIWHSVGEICSLGTHLHDCGIRRHSF